MKLDRLTVAEFNKQAVGKTELYELPNRAACESAKANIYRWGLMQKPTKQFTCLVRDNHFLLVTRIK